MAPRPELHQILIGLLGSSNVYFQPPPSLVMNYPCIVYNRSEIDIRHADDKPYKLRVRYQIMIIDRDPDSPFPIKVANLPLCTFDRFFTADNLNHDVFQLFY